MLSKIIGSALVIFLLGFSPEIQAHPRHHYSPAVVKIELDWVWVTAQFGRPAHWSHPYYGRSYRAKYIGPPPRRPAASAVWIPGHWEGRGRHRTWVNGRWNIRPRR